MHSYSSSGQIGFWIGYLIGALIVAIVFGVITKHINESKGYEGGFAWGFWLNIIGIIVVACKPDNRAYIRNVYATTSSRLNALGEEARDNKILSEGGWKCSCGKVNYPYYTSCINCGLHKWEAEKKKAIDESEKNKQENKNNDKNEIIELIKQLSDLHSKGILSDEEFESKKKELLSKV